MKQDLLQTLLVLAATGVSGGANAQAVSKEPAYPVKPIRFVVPYHPGGTPDIQGSGARGRLRHHRWHA